ncbi:acyltransferase [Caulobacter vibrioides]|uniref:Acyltransferase n=1 Tax=Caulobacter vibrioides TaxID=155892 RepID=A0A290MP27_CAUVI|nr:acyltransferase [Caulobacter vibrioides]ATC31549.1 acyltransferase [Caulobacter vibrioides]
MFNAGTGFAKASATPVLSRDGPLDALRFLAALFIVLYHVAERAPVSLFSLSPAFGRGYLATDFFLMLSGYVLARTYGARVASSEVNTWTFLKRRVQRIWPPHLVMLALFVAFFLATTAIGLAPQNPQWFQWDQLLPQIFLVQAWFVPGTSGWNMPTWTLSALIVAYALFPMVWRKVAATSRPLRLLAMGVCAWVIIDQAALMAFGVHGYQLPLRFGLIRGVPLFLIGVLIARLPVTRLAEQQALPLAAASLAMVIGIQALGSFDYFSLALLAFLIYAAGASKPRAWRWAGAAGRLSFPLFLTNTLTAVVWFGLVRMLDAKLGLPVAAQWTLWALAIPATIIAAWLFERLIDAPLQTWIKSRSRGAAAPHITNMREASA